MKHSWPNGDSDAPDPTRRCVICNQVRTSDNADTDCSGKPPRAIPTSIFGERLSGDMSSIGDRMREIRKAEGREDPPKDS